MLLSVVVVGAGHSIPNIFHTVLNKDYQEQNNEVHDSENCGAWIEGQVRDLERRLGATLTLISRVCELGLTQQSDECETSSEKNERHEWELERDNGVLPRAFILCFVSVGGLWRQAHICIFHEAIVLLAVIESRLLEHHLFTDISSLTCSILHHFISAAAVETFNVEHRPLEVRQLHFFSPIQTRWNLSWDTLSRIIREHSIVLITSKRSVAFPMASILLSRDKWLPELTFSRILTLFVLHLFIYYSN